MNKRTAAEQNCKDKVAPISHGAALQAFYGRMAATHEADHPWMMELATIISAQEDRAGEAGDDIDKIGVAVEIMDDLLKLALTKCVAIDLTGEAQSAIRAARRYAGDIREQTARMASGVAA